MSSPSTYNSGRAPLKLVKPAPAPTAIASQLDFLREKLDDPATPLLHRNLWGAALAGDVAQVKIAIKALRAAEPG